MTSLPDRDDFEPEECFHAEFRPDESAVLAVATAVSAVEGVPSDTLPPVGDVVDPDAVDALLASSGGEECWLAFEYEGYDVTVTAAGDIWIREPESPP